MSLARPPLSAVIITKNAASQLPECLESLVFCDEILVVDSGSDDGSIELARARGARVFEAENNWRRQRRSATTITRDTAGCRRGISGKPSSTTQSIRASG